MKLKRTLVPAVAAAFLALVAGAASCAEGTRASPLYDVAVPDGYRQWQLVAPAQEAALRDELCVVLGNDIAMQAYREGTLPFPDGTVLARLAWKHVLPSGFGPGSNPGAVTTVQFMVKDSKSMPPPADGASVDSSTESPRTSRSTGPVSPATRPW